jgi:hypothetical protein
MAAATKNLTIERGSTFTKRFFVVNKADNSAFDLTGYTSGEAQIRESATSKIILGSFTVTIPSPPTSGEVRYTMDDETTADLPIGIKQWDLFLVGSGSSGLGRWRILAGDVNIIPTVSK